MKRDENSAPAKRCNTSLGLAIAIVLLFASESVAALRLNNQTINNQRSGFSFNQKSPTKLIQNQQDWLHWQKLLWHPVLVSNNSSQLANGEHFLSSRSPTPNQHPDIHLAGAEIYAFLKQDNQVVGERFIANSGSTACFRGRIVGKVIVGESIVTGDLSRLSKQDLMPMQFDLSSFVAIARQDNTYAQGSVQRCQQLFNNLADQ
ncbi:hypothetical protein Pse7367_2770 [Thalassoporum mexicanum PCC 7367]|uniref:hypothetical protein n=1 Tax=Thalassoporum mexicanum TaxID=3457544 RepID=UPI00029FBC1D|nr:hypothetical protein [Pseudanabaena sp. PCC 7367]AFY71024.1 hypothetical protein Pse7367_2770 [Pseudanabaena sp. PCC 7367]